MTGSSGGVVADSVGFWEVATVCGQDTYPVTVGATVDSAEDAEELDQWLWSFSQVKEDKPDG